MRKNPLFYQRLQGQNLLVSEGAIRTAIELLKPAPEDVIMDIGAGTGNLSVPLSGKCRLVFALEKDPWMFYQLQEACRGKTNLQPVFADFFLTHELWCPAFERFPRVNKLVSNMPFSCVESILSRIAFIDFQYLVAVIGRKQLDRVSGCFPNLYGCFNFEAVCSLTDSDFYPQPNALARDLSGNDVALWIVTPRPSV